MEVGDERHFTSEQARLNKNTGGFSRRQHKPLLFLSFFPLFFYPTFCQCQNRVHLKSPPLSFSKVQWRQVMSPNSIPHLKSQTKSHFHQDHTKVEDRGTGLSKSLFCRRSSTLDGNLPVPWDSPHFTPPWCEICERVKKESCLQTWQLLKDGWMSGIQGCLEKRPAHHESQSKDKKTWRAKKRNITASEVRNTQWHSREGPHETLNGLFIHFKKTHWVVAWASINSVHIWQLKHAQFRFKAAR